MPIQKSSSNGAAELPLNRRQLLGAVSAVAGAAALAKDAPAAPTTPNRTVVRVATVSYTPPFHDHRASGVDLRALREMTARVARERPGFVCYPEGCARFPGGFG